MAQTQDQFGNFRDAAPVSISAPVGSQVSLADYLQKAYGDNASSIQSVFVSYFDPQQMTPGGKNWVEGGTPITTKILNNGADIGVGNFVSVDKSQFSHVMISVGNNIVSNVAITIPEANGTSHQLFVTTIPQDLDANHPTGHIPTAADIVDAAKNFILAHDNNLSAPVDCHNIATAIAASAGATFGPDTGNTVNPALNVASGFWRIVSAGANADGDSWQSQVQAGDIVRMKVVNPGGAVTEHTVTVVGGLNSDPAHPGTIQVVDNSNGTIHENSADLHAVAGTVTIYRLTTDGQYLIDQSSDSHNDTILGDNFNDLIKVGHGNDTVNGGAGIDTAVLTGNKADYTMVHNADGSETVSGHGITDKLISIEKVQFDDQTVDLTAAPAPPPPPPPPAPVAGSVSINDVSIVEGNNGQQFEKFTVTRTGGTAAFDVHFATADGTATTADHDYVAQSGNLHFADGVNSQTVLVAINGDTKVEPNETYSVNLSGATNGATISHAQGIGTIVNDDVAPTPPPPPPAPVAGSVSINDVSIVEGNNGQQFEKFTVTRTGGTAAFDVHFATADGTATTADHDYVAQSGNLHFADGVNTQTVLVAVNGDTKVEANETFSVHLSGATAGATISHADGIGTIINDDVAPTPPPAPVAGSVSIGDASVVEGNSGQQAEVFTVTRSGGSAAFDVHFATHAGTASAADGDYDAQSGNLHFNAGETSKTISIMVNGDTKVEPNETFTVNLTNATNGATISHAQGTGTIVNDDTAPASHHVVNDFNGDGISDVLFGNSKNGNLSLWEMDGDNGASKAIVGSTTGWHIDGNGDFNGDGKTEVLMHNDSGQYALAQMNGDQMGSPQIFGHMGSDFHVKEVADFSGDGKADILWQNDQGRVVMWQMDGSTIAHNTGVGSIGTDYKAVAAADFDGDGKADILWQNQNTGKVVMWQMDGDHIKSNTGVGSTTTDWKVVGTGDFNGDHKADILLQNQNTGKVAEWQMDGDHIKSNTTVNAPTDSKVIGTGNFDHDGKTDVLVQNSHGTVSELHMDGDHVTEQDTIGSHSVNWHVV